MRSPSAKVGENKGVYLLFRLTMYPEELHGYG